MAAKDYVFKIGSFNGKDQKSGEPVAVTCAYINGVTGSWRNLMIPLDFAQQAIANMKLAIKDLEAVQSKYSEIKSAQAELHAARSAREALGPLMAKFPELAKRAEEADLEILAAEENLKAVQG